MIADYIEDQMIVKILGIIVMKVHVEYLLEQNKETGAANGILFHFIFLKTTFIRTHL